MEKVNTIAEKIQNRIEQHRQNLAGNQQQDERIAETKGTTSRHLQV